MWELKMPVGEAAVTALLGYAVVFFGLILLMIVVMILGKVMVASAAKKKAAAPAAALVEEKEPVYAPGTAGEVKLYDVSDRDAAMIMAIVADKLQKPLNELRFKSIKEVK